MRPTFITDEASQEPDEFLEIVERFELDAVELRGVSGTSTWTLDDEPLDALRRQLADHGVAVCCLDTPILKSPFDERGPHLERSLDRALRAAARLDAPLVRIFSFWRAPDRAKRQEAIVETLRALGRRARGAGAKLAIENGRRTMHATAGELADLLEALDDDAFCALWDPGNAALSGAGPEPDDALRRLAPHLRHVHVKDPRFYTMSHRPVGIDPARELDLAKQVAQLAACGYRGYVSMETHWRPDRTIPLRELDLPGAPEFTRGGWEATVDALLALSRLVRTEVEA